MLTNRLSRLMIIIALSFSPLLQASSSDEVEPLIKELRALAICFKEGGQCLRRNGMRVRELGKAWHEGTQAKLRASLQEYNDELLQEFDKKASLSEADILKSMDRMEQLRKAAEASQASAHRDKDVKRMDYANEKIKLWNKFVAKWRKLAEVVKGAKSDYSFSLEEASEVLACSAQMMNDGMHLYFRGCDFDREADIFDEYGLDLTEEDFNKICEDRRNKARGLGC